MAYTTINKSTNFFDTGHYTGNGGTINVTGMNFQPAFSWLKCRSIAYHHRLYDAIRGVGVSLRTNSSLGDTTNAGEGVTAFNSDGITVIQGSNTEYGNNGETYASWNWKAGTTSGLSGGTITPSSYSINTTSKFGIYKYTGNGTNGATIAHGLGATPTFMIFKKTSGTDDWKVYHKSIGAAKSIRLDSTDSESSDSTLLNSTAPTSTLITLGTSSAINTNGETYICYAFCDVEGYCKAGSYIGNAAATNSPFVYCGFKPKLLLGKRSDAAGQNWFLIDATRQEYNNKGNVLYPEVTTAEGTTYYIDFFSNGWRWNVAGSGENGSGNTYIFMAIGQTMVGTNNVPATAR